MQFRLRDAYGRSLFLMFLGLSVLYAGVVIGCGGRGQEQHQQAEKNALEVPRGFVSRIEFELNDRLLGFGPFVGYYFRSANPVNPRDFKRLTFICFNEKRFYTQDLPENAELFEGEAILTQLPEADVEIPTDSRINPVFFPDAPEKWRNTRNRLGPGFVHFHSCYDDAGPVRAGYWLKHTGLAEFTYDMGGRVGPQSPLYHKVEKGPDHRFAKVLEFDRGPGS